MNKQQHRFVEELLDQQPELSSKHYVNYRQQLDTRLSMARREERTMRWILAGVWICALGLFLGTALFILPAGRNGSGDFPDWFIYALVASILLMPVGGLLLLGLYLFKYRRRVVQVRQQAQKAALEEVQRQINELRVRLLPPIDP